MRVCDLNPFLRFYAELRNDLIYNDTPVKVSDCRLFYILKGCAQLTTGMHTFSLSPGSLFYCPAGSCYTIHTQNAMQLICLNFDLTQQWNDHILPMPPSRDPSHWPSMPVFSVFMEDSLYLNSFLFLEKMERFLPQLEQIIEDCSSGERFGKELGSAQLKNLLIRLHRQDVQQLPSKLQLIQKYMQTNYACPLTNQHLADLVGYHEYYLNRIFTAYVGQSLHAYLMNIRLCRASYLILNTDMDLKSISEQVGFSSYPHFSAAFKQSYGYAPAKYRKQLRNI